jgi:uncharacterized oligopeptide transporter (OPT) family protein
MRAPRARQLSRRASTRHAALVGPEGRTSAPQLTLRAIVTGMLLAAVLAPSNIYAGLKLGWGFNMSLTSALLSYGIWQGALRRLGARPLNILENNINQTTASAGASIASSGLIAAIPALTLLTGYEWDWARLCVWTLSVSMLGVAVALVLRRPMLEGARLTFPSGFVTGTVLQQLYAEGSGAMKRVAALVVGAAIGAASRLAATLLGWAPLPLPGALHATSAALRTHGVERVTLGNLGFALDPSPLMFAVGAIIGLRAALSLVLGALVAWGVLAPIALAHGWVAPGPADPNASWFGSVVEWLLWPGVAMMVSASLTSVALSLRGLRRGLLRSPSRSPRGGRASRVVMLGALGSAGAVAVAAQVGLFGIALGAAAAGVVLTVALATVAARVTGETDITPVGAMGQLTQLCFGVLAPSGVTANLMAANVTGGAASQCADLLQDLRSGQIVGASSTYQFIAQIAGVVAGAVAGSAVYLLLIPDPSAMLMTDEWAAPAVVTWKAVAEVFARGPDGLPPFAILAMSVGGLVGVGLTMLERGLPAARARWVPSAASVGLAMVIPASYALSMGLGAVAAALAGRLAPGWSVRFVLVLAAGLIAGESITGVGLATEGAVRALFSP